jgi:hypothetical protein
MTRDACAIEIFMKIYFEIVEAWHFVVLAAFRAGAPKAAGFE